MFPVTHNPATLSFILARGFNPLLEPYPGEARFRIERGCWGLSGPGRSREYPPSFVKPCTLPVARRFGLGERLGGGGGLPGTDVVTWVWI